MRKRYKLDVKVQALAALDASRDSLFQTAIQLNIPRQTLSDWNCQRGAIYAQYQRALERQGWGLAQQMELVIHQLVAALPGKVDAAKLGETVKALSVIIELKNAAAVEDEKREDYREKLYARLQRLYEEYQANHAGEMGEAPDVVMLPERTGET